MTDVYLRQGQATPTDVVLRDPTLPDSVANVGVLSVTLGTMTVTSAARLDIQAQSAVTLGAMTLESDSIIETVGSDITGSLSVVFDEMTALSRALKPVGAIDNFRYGVISPKRKKPMFGGAGIPLGTMTAQAVGSLAISAKADIVLEAMSVNAVGAVGISGALGSYLDAMTARSESELKNNDDALILLLAVSYFSKAR